MRSAIRLVRLVQIVFLVSIVLSAVIGERLGRKLPPENTLFHALSFGAIIIVGSTIVVRRTLIAPAEDLLKKRPDDMLTVARWRSGYLFIYAMCEALGLLGLVLRLLGFALVQVWGFYLGGFLLLLLFSPRPPHAEFR
jgi:hypothetical protein